MPTVIGWVIVAVLGAAMAVCTFGPWIMAEIDEARERREAEERKQGS